MPIEGMAAATMLHCRGTADQTRSTSDPVPHARHAAATDVEAIDHAAGRLGAVAGHKHELGKGEASSTYLCGDDCATHCATHCISAAALIDSISWSAGFQPTIRELTVTTTHLHTAHPIDLFRPPITAAS